MVKSEFFITTDRDAVSINRYGYKFEDLTAGRKAIVTKMLNNSFGRRGKALSHKDKKSRITKGALTKEYSGNGKSLSRNIVKDLFASNGVGTVLALESSEQRLVKSLPQHKFVICEHNPLTYEILNETRLPNLMMLIKGDVSEAKKFELNYKYAWLDFCNTFSVNKDSLYDLKNVLNNCDFLAFTFAYRNWRGVGRPKKIPDEEKLKDKDKFEKMDKNDYGFYVLKELQKIYRNHEFYKRVSYKDGAPMLCMIMKRRDLEAN